MKDGGNEMDTDKFAEQATRLIELVEYQEGSIVSRMLIDKSAGTLTLFAFDKGQSLSLSLIHI